MKVIVENNDIGKALRKLKNKIKKDNFIIDFKAHQFYVKPSVKKRLKKLTGIRRFIIKEENLRKVKK